MASNSPILSVGIPLIIWLLSALPLIFISKFEKNNAVLKGTNSGFIICYLFFMGLAILVLIIIQAIEVMGFNTGIRALFICSVLLVACLERLIDLSAIRTRIKANLITTLQYFVTLLCSIPIIWQLLLFLVPQSISSQLKIMTGIEISLMLLVLLLGIINRPTKKTEVVKRTND